MAGLFFFGVLPNCFAHVLISAWLGVDFDSRYCLVWGSLMKRTLSVLILSSVIACSVLYARQKNPMTIHNGFLKADLYLKLSEDSQRAYAMGLLDGMYMAPFFGAPDNDKLLMKFTSCVEGMKSSQVAAIIEKYIREHPERWDWDLKDDGYETILEACQQR